jgi:endo-1,4-beta-xylanase
MPTSIKIYFAIFVMLILTAIVMIFIRKCRKTGLIALGILITILVIAGLWIFHPKHYDRKYLEQSSEWKNLFIRQYADSLGFYLGAIPGGTEISDPLFYRNFNSVTPENALKMGPLLKDLKIGQYDFTAADMIVNEALQKNLRIRGHTLVWGKQSDTFKKPDLRKWLETFPKADRSRILKETMENHITTVLDHFRGKINIWDCVNEPTSYIRKGRLENNVYLKYLGEDYIAEAFRIAHSVDPDIKLFLNEELYDYNDRQASFFVDLVRKLKENDVPVHGIGIQSHIAIDTAIADLKDYISKFTDMGLEVEITELDIRLRLFDGYEDPYEEQGKYYARLIDACMANPMCKGVTFWGFSDDNCWMDSYPFPKPNEPYLFDAEKNPKPAFYDIYKTMKAEWNKKATE